MRKIFLLLTVAFAASVSSPAQTYVHQVFILNEGRFDYVNNVQAVPVTIGSYDPQTSVYNEFAIINNARFASDLVVTDDYFYVAADSFLIKYDKNSLQELDQQIVYGIRKMAIADGKIVVTRGDYLVPLSSYAQVYDEASLDLLYEIPTDVTGIEYSTSDLTIVNNKAYIAVNNGFSFPFTPVGYLAVLDLNSETIVDQIDLGAYGLNPENVMLNGNQIFTLNNNDYNTSSISTIDATNNSSQTTSLSLISGCGSSMNLGSDVFYQAMYDPNEITSKNLGRFNTSSQSTIDTLFMNRSIYGMAADPVNNLIYVAETDYTSYGLIVVYDENGILQDAFAANVSPSTIVFDLREGNANSVSDINNEMELMVSPNPFVQNISVVVKNISNDDMNLRVLNLFGQVVYEKTFEKQAGNIYQQINLSDLSSGIYFVELTQGDQQIIQRVVKQ